MSRSSGLGELYPHANGDLAEYYVRTAVPNAPKHTGFVPNLADPETSSTQAFRMFNTHQEGSHLCYGSTFNQQATVRIHAPTALNQAFFSEENIELLQQEIRYRVWVKSENKHIIDRQRADELKTIMRSYYLQYSENNPGNEANELEMLNERVLTYCVNDILGSINTFLYHRKETLDFPAPISNPINPDVRGTKTAEFKAFF
uniref:Minor capsid protein P8 central region domain-containing protein n=1 Tax=viral metagenome TaxID=1070528 RepID=A0A6C0K6N4_9ZZZZ